MHAHCMRFKLSILVSLVTMHEGFELTSQLVISCLLLQLCLFSMPVQQPPLVFSVFTTAGCCQMQVLALCPGGSFR